MPYVLTLFFFILFTNLLGLVPFGATATGNISVTAALALLSLAVIEVSGADRPGLLAELARVVADHGLSIRSAHIAGFGERAVDSFYVTDAEGRKPAASAVLDDLRDALEAVLDRRDPSAKSVSAPVRASLRDVSEFGRRHPVSPGGEAR